MADSGSSEIKDVVDIVDMAVVAVVAVAAVAVVVDTIAIGFGKGLCYRRFLRVQFVVVCLHSD